MKNVVQPRIQPKLVRTNSVIRTQPTIKIVSKAVVDIKDLQKAKENKQVHSAKVSNRPAVTPPKQQSLPTKRTQLKRTQVQKRNVKVRYSHRETTPESKEKIKNLRGQGRGKMVAIIGNGPSINTIPLGDIRGKLDTISINKPDDRLWPTTHWAFFDGNQMRRHADLWESYSGTIFNSTSITKQKERSMMFKNIGGHGFSRNLIDGIHIGMSSVYATMQIVLWMDYDHIFIFGCDMNPDGLDGKLHFYGVNPDIDPSARAKKFVREAEYYDKAADILDENERQRYTFCSLGINPHGFINRFGAITPEESIHYIYEMISNG